MAIPAAADQYFTYESRLASFQSAQQLSKRRASNASSKASKSMKWPHKFLSAEELAKAGFFYYPLQANPDNVACFLCHKSLDGWEEDDDPLAEHLKHSPDCGWAIVAAIEKQDGDLSEEYPASVRMIEARKATFADKWPHEGKKGWKCKVKQMVDAGWKYTPTNEYDDMATCTYCSLALDGWEPSDKPLDEHFNRSPECAFFTLINNHKQSPATKRTKAKRDRTSKASRLSTQSSFTVASEAPSVADLPAEDEDSILTTATNATTTQGKKMGKLKKTTSTKGRKTKAKKGEPLEAVVAPEPEDDDFEVKVDTAPKTTRGKKRKSDDASEPTSLAIDIEAPAPKRRATRTRGSMAVDDLVLRHIEEVEQEAPKPAGGKRRPSAKNSRKASAASVALLKANVPDDDEIDKALEADLNRALVGEEEKVPSEPPISVSKKATRASKISKDGHAMFGVDHMEFDEAEIEAELDAMEIDSKPLPKAKGAKGKQPRKVSAKQQAAAKKAAEAEAEAQRLAEEEASQQIAAELEHSISMQHSSPVIQPKKQRASRQPSRQPGGRATRGSVLSVSEKNTSLTDENPDPDCQKEDSGNDTDVSMASQSTIVRGGSTRRGSTMKKGKGGKKAASRNIEEIVHKVVEQATSVEGKDLVPSAKGKKVIRAEEISIVEEMYYTPAPEAPAPELEEPAPKVVKAKPVKMRGRPAKTAPSSQPSQAEEDTIMGADVPIQPKAKSTKAKTAAPPPRAPTAPPKERTPSESPQSSDAENHPPSSKPSAATKKTTTPHSTRRVPLASTPNMSPSKRNVIAGLQSSHPWTSVDLDAVFMKSPGGENSVGNMTDIFGGAIEKAKSGDLTSPEKKMTVEEWIHHNAEMAEEKLRNECERMVGTFEREGTRAMRALEGVECVE